jgi:hypothetical protein
MNLWPGATPGAEIVHGVLGCQISFNDMADPPPVPLDDDQVLDIGGTDTLIGMGLIRAQTEHDRTPRQSGAVAREQGVSKAGNARVRTTMIQLSWLWLRHQPGSAFTVWFQARSAAAGGRNRRILIVALACKLLVALWKFATMGLLPDGAVIPA